MAPESRIWATFPEFYSQYPCSGSQTPVTSSKDSSTTFWLPEAPGTYLVHRHTCMPSTYTLKIFIIVIINPLIIIPPRHSCCLKFFPCSFYPPSYECVCVREREMHVYVCEYTLGTCVSRDTCRRSEDHLSCQSSPFILFETSSLLFTSANPRLADR